MFAEFKGGAPVRPLNTPLESKAFLKSKYSTTVRLYIRDCRLLDQSWNILAGLCKWIFYV